MKGSQLNTTSLSHLLHILHDVCVTDANGAHRDVVHTLHWGVLYSQNVARFQSARANVISVTATKNTRAASSNAHTSPTTLCTGVLHRTSPKPGNKCGKWGAEFRSRYQGELWLMMRLFLRNSQLLDKFFRMSPILKVRPIGWVFWK
jgi:hypothetical protein